MSTKYYEARFDLGPAGYHDGIVEWDFENDEVKISKVLSSESHCMGFDFIKLFSWEYLADLKAEIEDDNYKRATAPTQKEDFDIGRHAI